MIRFTIWDLVGFFGFEALLYAGAPMTAAVALVLAIPRLRRTKLLRWLAYVMAAVTCTLVLCAAPMLQELWNEHEESVAFDAATHHLTTPQTFGGIAFPTGSIVHVGQDGQVQSGSLPVPTVIFGLTLIGDFRLAAEDGAPPQLPAATLAADADIHGIPCGAGPLAAQTGSTRCVLARDYAFGTYLLARGNPVEIYRSPLGDPPLLNFGTLARPERSFGVLWPAGTIVGGLVLRSDPARPPEFQRVEFCLQSGQAAALAGATLHGFLAYAVQAGRRTVRPVCDVLPDDRVGDDGYAQVGTDRFTWGERADSGAAWTWTQPFQPADAK